MIAKTEVKKERKKERKRVRLRELLTVLKEEPFYRPFSYKRCQKFKHSSSLPDYHITHKSIQINEIKFRITKKKIKKKTR